jgi:GT2 family glycosyltransferase
VSRRASRVAVITIASGRHDHLARQQLALATSALEPSHYVVVAMDDAEIATWNPTSPPHPEVIELRSGDSGLPLAAARNLGARRAIDAGADLLVFLDVDCIPSAGALERYADAAASTPGALLAGAVGYLPAGAANHDPGTWADAAHFHAFRPRLPDGEIAPAEVRLFWSLSFACSPSTWRAIGGFDESYSGYGGEDTDFGMRAELAGIPFRWVGGAEVFHQHHPTNDPPTQHLDDILENGRRFVSRWGFWPMEGWLADFEALGLVARNPVTGDWRRVGMEG